MTTYGDCINVITNNMSIVEFRVFIKVVLL